MTFERGQCIRMKHGETPIMTVIEYYPLRTGINYAFVVVCWFDKNHHLQTAEIGADLVRLA